MKEIKTNLNHYKSFLEIYETKNYSVAANNLKLTQPTMSYNIRELEKQLRVRLFNTNSRGVEPTKNADELYPIVKEAFVHLLHAENSILEFNEKSQGIVRLNVSLYFMPQIIGNLIASFNKKFPNIRFEISSSTIGDGSASIERHESDLFIFAYSKPQINEKNKFTQIDLFETDTEFYASKDFLKEHNLESTITKEQLSQLPLISAPGNYQMRGEIEKLGLSKTPLIETASTEMFTSLAANDVGVIFGPGNYINEKLVKLVVKDITMPKVYFAVKYNNNLANKAGTAFIEHIKKEYNI